jgi:hypothetical protein
MLEEVAVGVVAEVGAAALGGELEQRQLLPRAYGGFKVGSLRTLAVF